MYIKCVLSYAFTCRVNAYYDVVSILLQPTKQNSRGPSYAFVAHRLHEYGFILNINISSLHLEIFHDIASTPVPANVKKTNQIQFHMLEQ